MLLQGEGPVTNPNGGGVGGRLGPARRWGAVRIPDACLAMVQRDIGFLLEGLLQPFIKGAGAGCRAEEVDIIEISQDGLTRLERLVGLVEGGGDRGGEQAWHEGVSLFTPFVLENAVSSAAGIIPNVFRRRAVELAHEGEQGVEPGVPLEAVEDRVSGDMIIRADAINGEDAQRRLDFCRDAHGSCERFAARPCGQGELVGGRGRLELGAELLGEGAGDEAAEDVAEYEASDATIWFLKRNESPQPDRGQDGSWHGRRGEEVRGVGEVAAIFITREKDAKMLHGHAGWARGGAAPPCAEIFEEPRFIQTGRGLRVVAEEGGVNGDLRCLGPVRRVAQLGQGCGGEGGKGPSGEGCAGR